MEIFKLILALILKWEGVYDNDPDDGGGETCFGITRVYEGGWQGWQIIDAMFKAAGITDRQTESAKAWATENLPKNPALMDMVSIYYNAVYRTLELQECPSVVLASCIMGGWVNQGPRVEKWLQEAILELCVGVEVDGNIGPATMRAVAEVMKNPMGETALLHGLMLKRVKAYAKSKPKFIAGLLARLFAGA